jgi:F-type H+-transporting ATPase subunit b
LLATSGAHDPPLIDLDSTVFIQLVVFVLTSVVLSKFLFKPFLAMREERGKGIEGARGEATRMEDEARAKIADYEQRFAKARTRATEERAKLRLEAAEREREIAEAARKDTESAVGGARAQLERDAAEARTQLAPRAEEIARSIAKKVLGREVA